MIKTHTNQTNKDETQGKNIKNSKGKATKAYKGNPTHLTADLSAETLQARREWQDIFKVLKQKNLQPRLVYKRYKRRKKIYKINPKQLRKWQ